MPNKKNQIKVASRKSPLAQVQVDEVERLLKEKRVRLAFDRVFFDTEGDKNKRIPLTKNAQDNFFTDTLDRAVIYGKADIAVHSAKDLPRAMDKRLAIFALTKSMDETDCYVGRSTLKKLKKGSRVGTSSELRQAQVKAINPHIKIVNIRGTIQERLALVKNGKIDGMIVATVALKRLGLDDLIKEVLPYDTTPLQGSLAIVGRAGNRALEKQFAKIDIRQKYGKVILVGAGPGDPELITVKGIKALQACDVVFYDFLVHQSLLDHCPKAEKIYVGKRKGAHSLPQEILSMKLREKAQQGNRVVRLKGGDPLVFGRGADEISYLSSYHIPVDVIAGVSSATALPSSLGIPLTARDTSSSVAFVSGHEKGEKGWDKRPVRIPDVDTIVFLMGLTKLDIILSSLKKKKWKDSTPIVIISRGTRVDEKIIVGTLKDIKQKVKREKPQPPALIVVGDTVRYLKEKPLTKEKVVYTGTNPKRYESLGDVVHLPMIKIKKKKLSSQDKKKALKYLEASHIVLLTSRYSVKYLFELIREEKFSKGDLTFKDFFVIGKETAAALRTKGFEPVLTPQVETSEGLFEAIKNRYSVDNKHIFFPRSSLPNPFLEQQLTDLGAKVDVLSIYENIKPVKRPLPDSTIKDIIFTSPSTVVNFIRDYGHIPEDWRIISRGPLTTKKLKEEGYESQVLINE